jgi:hypothetical protein
LTPCGRRIGEHPADEEDEEDHGASGSELLLAEEANDQISGGPRTTRAFAGFDAAAAGASTGGTSRRTGVTPSG